MGKLIGITASMNSLLLQTKTDFK